MRANECGEPLLRDITIPFVAVLSVFGKAVMTAYGPDRLVRHNRGRLPRCPTGSRIRWHQVEFNREDFGPD